jgi:SAM-dependent methyltransferase
MIVDAIEPIKGRLQDVGKTLQSNHHEATGTFLHMGDVWAVAGAYEAYVGRWSRRVAAEFVRWLDIPAGRRWLDAGCGTGALSETVLGAATPATVIGVDMSRGFLSEAQRRISAASTSASAPASASASGSAPASASASASGNATGKAAGRATQGNATGEAAGPTTPGNATGKAPGRATPGNATGEAAGPVTTGFVAGDAAALPLADGRFDAVVSGLALNFVPRPQRAVAEFARVAAPGATVAAYVWDYADGMRMMRYFWDAAIDVDPAAAERDEGPRFPICHPGALREAWTEAGFTGVETRAIEVPTVFADFDDYWRPFLGGQGPGPAYLLAMPAGQREAVRALLDRRLPRRADGSIALTARAWAARGTARR